jgi:four helix bundle protein
MERYRNLEVWQLADALALEIYRETKHFPRDEVYGITAQLRRAALSVPTNIVEGYSRRGDKELARFLDIALGSLGELRYLLSFSLRLGYLSEERFAELESKGDNLGKKLWRFYGKVRRVEAPG